LEKIKFSDLNLSENALKAVSDMGYELPSPIQSLAIPKLLTGIDLVGQAQTGTGKTAAFGIPIVEKVEGDRKVPQAIIIVPTRELAIQVAEQIYKLSAHFRKIRVLPVYGGQPIERQTTALRKGVQIIVGTPGRVLDHIRRKNLNLSEIQHLVLDEADEMLDMGFADDIKEILRCTPPERQTIMFSATMSREILSISKKYLKDAEVVRVKHEELTVPLITQSYFEVHTSKKFELLCRLMDIKMPKLSIVFVNTKKVAEELSSMLQSRGYFAEGLHGDLPQSRRNTVMNKFRNGDIDILVATDVAARGIDIDNVEAVFNYDFPQDEEFYVHRIGRTGRAGKEGHAYSFAFGKDFNKLKYIERYTKSKIKREKLPTSFDVSEVKTKNFITKIKEVLDAGDLDRYTSLLEGLTGEYSSFDLAAALFKIALPLGKSSQEDDLSPPPRRESFSYRSGKPTSTARLFMNIGKREDISPAEIAKIISEETGVSGKSIGIVTVYDNFSFAEVARKHSQEIINKMSKSRVKGKTLFIEYAKERKRTSFPHKKYSSESEHSRQKNRFTQ